MIVDNLDIVRIAVLPSKADAPLIVDTNAVSTFPPAAQCLEPIAGRHDQVLKSAGSMQVQELPPRLPLTRTKPRDEFVGEESGRVAVSKRSDHP